MTRSGPASRLISCVLVLLAAPIRAGEETVVLDDFPVRAEQAGGAAGAVGRERIAVHKPLDLADVLAREVAAVSLVRKGPLGGDFLLRGLGRDNLRISLDGITVHGACPNRMDPPAFHVSSQQVAAVAVRRGPFDVEDGGTVGGTIRVGTLPCCDTPEALAAFVGSFGYRSASGSMRTHAGETTLSASAAWQQGGVYADGTGRRFTELLGLNYRAGARERTAFEVMQAEGKLSTFLGAGILDLRGGYHRATDVLYPGLRMDALLDESWRTGATWTWQPAGNSAVRKLVVEASASGVYHDMRDTWRTSAAAATWAARGWMMRTQARTTAAKLRATAETAVGDWTVRYGASVERRGWDADNRVGARANDMLPDVVADTAGAYVLGALDRGAWGLEMAARLDVAKSRAQGDLAFVRAAHGLGDERGRNDTLPAAYVLGHRMLGAAKIYAGLGHAGRAPDPQERYQNLDHPSSGDWVGNPRLGPTRATEVQVGAAVPVGAWTVRASAFHSWLHDYIYLARLLPAPGSTANPANTKTYVGLDARLLGGDLTATWQPTPHWSLDLGVAAQRGVKRDLAPGNASRVLGEVPAVQARLAVQWSPAPWAVRVQWQGAPRQGRVDPGIGERPVAGWGTVAVTLAWKPRESVELSVGAENLFDRAYTLHNAYTRDPFAAGVAVPEPGRFLFARVSWRR